MNQIGCFGHTLDPLFFSAAARKQLLVFIPKQHKQLQILFKGFAIELFDYANTAGAIEEQGDADLFKKSALKVAIKRTGIKQFLISHRSTAELTLAAKKINLQLIGNKSSWAERFENKIFFDLLLTELKVKKPLTISAKNLKNYPQNQLVVLQVPDSFGSFGTKILSAESAQKITTQKKERKFLIREFVAGRIFGISVFIDQKNAVFSSVREQCYYRQNGSTPVFAGIQWIPTSDLSKKAIRNIETAFRKITKATQAKGITGILNFDFILDSTDAVFVLECNPRPSSATPQLLQHPELVHNLDISNFLLGNKSLPSNRQSIPLTSYQGSLFDLMSLKKVTIKKKTGLPISNTEAALFIYAPGFQATTVLPAFSIKAGQFLGMILSNRRLFTHDAHPNQFALDLYSRVTGISLAAIDA